jgi:hypothetical protein
VASRIHAVQSKRHNERIGEVEPMRTLQELLPRLQGWFAKRTHDVSELVSEVQIRVLERYEVERGQAKPFIWAVARNVLAEKRRHDARIASESVEAAEARRAAEERGAARSAGDCRDRAPTEAPRRRLALADGAPFSELVEKLLILASAGAGDAGATCDARRLSSEAERVAQDAAGELLRIRVATDSQSPFVDLIELPDSAVENGEIKLKAFVGLTARIAARLRRVRPGRRPTHGDGLEHALAMTSAILRAAGLTAREVDAALSSHRHRRRKENEILHARAQDFSVTDLRLQLGLQKRGEPK